MSFLEAMAPSHPSFEHMAAIAWSVIAEGADETLSLDSHPCTTSSCLPDHFQTHPASESSRSAPELSVATPSRTRPNRASLWNGMRQTAFNTAPWLTPYPCSGAS